MTMTLRLEFERRLTFARAAALDAGKLILGHYQSASLTVDRKRDSSPVTIADRNAEEFLRNGIAREFPADAILGEEFGETPGTSGFRWILATARRDEIVHPRCALVRHADRCRVRGKCVVGVCHIQSWAKRRGAEKDWGPVAARRRPGAAGPCLERRRPLAVAVLFYDRAGGLRGSAGRTHLRR